MIVSSHRVVDVAWKCRHKNNGIFLINTQDKDVTHRDIADWSNYCRNPDSDINGPWCLVGHSADVMDMQYCDIDACSEYA